MRFGYRQVQGPSYWWGPVSWLANQMESPLYCVNSKLLDLHCVCHRLAPSLGTSCNRQQQRYYTNQISRGCPTTAVILFSELAQKDSYLSQDSALKAARSPNAQQQQQQQQQQKKTWKSCLGVWRKPIRQGVVTPLLKLYWKITRQLSLKKLGDATTVDLL